MRLLLTHSVSYQQDKSCRKSYGHEFRTENDHALYINPNFTRLNRYKIMNRIIVRKYTLLKCTVKEERNLTWFWLF